jgi:hypothetical protein
MFLDATISNLLILLVNIDNSKATEYTELTREQEVAMQSLVYASLGS